MSTSTSTSSIDRQQLLEQKRQRLQELKQKRLLQQQSSSPLPTNEASPIFIEQPNRKRINVSTQTQSDISTIPDTKLIIEKEVNRYDKAVQTSTAFIEETEKAELNPSVKLIDKQEIPETELNDALTSSIKLINKLHITNTITLENGNHRHINGNSSSGIERWTTFDTKHSIAAIESRDNLLAIAFTKGVSNDAIIYNMATPKLFSEYYLNSLSQIEVLKFDSYNRNRIIGGLQNGGLCVWELSDTEISSMAVLSTPLYTSIMNNSANGKSVSLHLNKIVFLAQLLIDGNVCIVSISQEGLLNIWSTNLLAEPKMSFKIFNNENNLHKLQVRSGVYLGPDEVVGTDFIADIIISANDGSLDRKSVV